MILDWPILQRTLKCWDRLQHLCDPAEDKEVWRMDGWIYIILSSRAVRIEQSWWHECKN